MRSSAWRSYCPGIAWEFRIREYSYSIFLDKIEADHLDAVFHGRPGSMQGFEQRREGESAFRDQQVKVFVGRRVVEFERAGEEDFAALQPRRVIAGEWPVACDVAVAIHR